MARSQYRGSFAEKVLSRQRSRRRILSVVLLLFGISILHTFFLQSIAVGSISMEPGIKKGDVLLATPFLVGPTTIFGKLPGLSSPPRGAIVVYTRVSFSRTSVVKNILIGLVRFFTLQKLPAASKGDPISPDTLSVGRVIAVPGDAVRMENGRFEVKKPGSGDFVDEFAASSVKYATLSPKNKENDAGPFGVSIPETLLGKGEYFVMGDNRAVSSGSELLGAIHAEQLYDLVFMRYWPLRRIGAP